MTEDKALPIQFYVAGVKFHKLGDIADVLQEGDSLELIPERDNEYDPNAVAIKRRTVMLGYVPKKYSKLVAGELEHEWLMCEVIRFNPANEPWNQLMVKIDRAAM